MKKLVLIFFIVAIIKSILLFLTILIGDWLPNIHSLLRFLVLFIVLWFVDSVTIEKIKELIAVSWIKLTIFLFGTHVLILILTGPLFILYNKLIGIQPNSEVETPTAGIVGFLIITLAISAINSANKMKKLKRATAHLPSSER